MTQRTHWQLPSRTQSPSGMFEILKIIAFTLLFLRYILWVSASFTQPAYTFRIFIAQFAEGVLAFFFFMQLFGKVVILPMNAPLIVQITGFVCVLGGVMLAFAAKKQLGQEWVYASDYKKQKGETLVTAGVYAPIRHPIYTGILLSYVGIEVLVNSWLWVYVLIFLVTFYLQAKKEETFLQEKFGEKYTEYKRQTKMFVPGLF